MVRRRRACRQGGERGKLEAGETTYYAKWTPHKFTINFDSNGGSDVQQQTYDYGDAVSLPKNVTKDNYEFVAWCTDKECQNEVDFSVGFSKETYLYAKYVAKKHTFSFDVMGGDEEISPYTARWDDVDLPSPTKTGCTFVGWYCADADNVYAAEFDKEQYAADKGAAGDLTLYAKWDANEYTVSFHTFSSAKVDSITGKYGDVIQKPADPIDDGSIFAGWYTTPMRYDEDKYTFDENPTIPENGLELYAKWDLKTWTITLKYKKINASGNEVESGDINDVSCTSNYSSFWLDNFDTQFNSGVGKTFIENLGDYNSIRILDEADKEIGDVCLFADETIFMGAASLPTTYGDYDYTLTLVCSPSEKTVTINLDEEGNDKLVYKLKIDTNIGDFLYSDEVKDAIERKVGKELYAYAYEGIIPLRTQLGEIQGDVTVEAVYYKVTLTLRVSNVMHVQDERDDSPGEVSYSTETVVLSRDSINPTALAARFNDVYYQNHKNADFKGVFITGTETMIIDENGNLCDSGFFDILPDEIEADCAYGYENIDYEEFGSGYIVTKIGDFDKYYTHLVLDEYRGQPIVGIAANAASSSVRTDYTIYAPNVVFIGDSAFRGSFIKAFLYGKKVSKIGAHAFDGSRLETGVFEGTNLVIGTNAFANCTKLKELTLSQVSELGAVPFVGCSELTTVHADKNAPLKKICASAFQDCKKLVTCDLLTISGLETVGNYAFKGCSAMTTEVTVALKEIGIRAFEGCEKITKVALTASLKKLGMGAFASCTGLQTVSMVAVANQAVDAAIFIGSGTGFTIDILDAGNYIKKWNKDWNFSGSAASVKYSTRTK